MDKSGAYTHADAMELLEEQRTRLVCRYRLLRPLAGGQPATQRGVEAFVEYQLKLVPDTKEFKEAVARIQKEEIGERDTTPDGGEVTESASYQINVIRRSDHGPFLLEHQVKAMLKQAASRLGLFVKKRGSKGNIAEMGTIRAIGSSLQNSERPWEIYLRRNGGPAATTFNRLHGRVRTPQGAKSIEHDTEVSEEGAEFEFEMRYLPGKGKVALDTEDMLRVLAAATQIGVGSCLSLGYGRMEIIEARVD